MKVSCLSHLQSSAPQKISCTKEDVKNKTAVILVRKMKQYHCMFRYEECNPNQTGVEYESCGSNH